MPKEVCDSDYAAMADAQARADSVAQTFGEHAPRPLQGETLPAYRRRLAAKYQPHSRDWKAVDLSLIRDDTAFGIAESAIYKDAISAAMNPADLPENTMRQIVNIDDAGRKVTTFVGKPSAWMNTFKSPSRRVTNIGLRKDN